MPALASSQRTNSARGIRRRRPIRAARRSPLATSAHVVRGEAPAARDASPYLNVSRSSWRSELERAEATLAAHVVCGPAMRSPAAVSSCVCRMTYGTGTGGTTGSGPNFRNNRTGSPPFADTRRDVRNERIYGRHSPLRLLGEAATAPRPAPGRPGWTPTGEASTVRRRPSRSCRCGRSRRKAPLNRPPNGPSPAGLRARRSAPPRRGGRARSPHAARMLGAGVRARASIPRRRRSRARNVSFKPPRARRARRPRRRPPPATRPQAHGPTRRARTRTSPSPRPPPACAPRPGEARAVGVGVLAAHLVHDGEALSARQGSTLDHAELRLALGVGRH